MGREDELICRLMAKLVPCLRQHFSAEHVQVQVQTMKPLMRVRYLLCFGWRKPPVAKPQDSAGPHRMELARDGRTLHLL